jgi:hypothetical protein
MLSLKMLLPLAFLTLSACKTTSRTTSSQVLSWSSEAMKQEARAQFIASITECVPMISGLVPGAKRVDLADNPERMAVVEQFVDRLISGKYTTKAERAAELLKLYYADNQQLGRACGAQTTDYILSEFALQTNVFEVAFGIPQKLRLL